MVDSEELNYFQELSLKKEAVSLDVMISKIDTGRKAFQIL